MSRADGTSRDDGFTLVELLVGLGLIAVVALLLTAVLATGNAAARRTERRAADGESVAAAQSLLRERIELLSADSSDVAGAASQDTSGDAARFTFVAPSPGNRADDGLARYYVALGAGGMLDLASVDARAGATPPPRWRVMPLIDDVRAIEWSFYGADPDGGRARWQMAWHDRADPPRLVRLRLRFAAGDPRTWPDLLVRPAATVSTACDLDPTTGTCRAS